MPSRNGWWMFLPLVVFIGLAVLLATQLGRNTEELPTALEANRCRPCSCPH